jgi:hypothetical protein
MLPLPTKQVRDLALRVYDTQVFGYPSYVAHRYAQYEAVCRAAGTAMLPTYRVTVHAELREPDARVPVGAPTPHDFGEADYLLTPAKLAELPQTPEAAATIGHPAWYEVVAHYPTPLDRPPQGRADEFPDNPALTYLEAMYTRVCEILTYAAPVEYTYAKLLRKVLRTGTWPDECTVVRLRQWQLLPTYETVPGQVTALPACVVDVQAASPVGAEQAAHAWCRRFRGASATRVSGRRPPRNAVLTFTVEVL